MARPDLNLLVTLDVLLQEGSVAGAARRLRLSPSAMSRALARLRAATGDPLLVRSGRGLVPTPRAAELRTRVGTIVRDAENALGPAETLDLGTLDRTFTLRTGDGFVETFGPALISDVAKTAPKVRLRFVSRSEWGNAPLREGAVDFETAVLRESTGPELKAQALFHDRFVGIVRAGHPLLRSAVTPESYAAARHVEVSAHSGQAPGPADAALAALGRTRHVAVVVGGFSAALALVRAMDLVATVPERHTAGLRDGLLTFELPMAMPEITVSLVWHPRFGADPGHRWLRDRILDACSRAIRGRCE